MQIIQKRLLAGRWPIFLFFIFSGLYQNIMAQGFYTVIDKDTLGSGAYPTLILGKDRVLHTTFWNEFEDRLYYGTKHPDSSRWDFERIDVKPGGYRSALYIDVNQNPHVAYFENVGGQSRVRYAQKSNSVWTIESVSERDFGMYGPAALDGPGNIQASISLYTDGQQPIIVFFDGTFIDCRRPAVDFGLEMQRAVKGPGGWTVTSFGDIQAFDISYIEVIECEGKAGARYGEFCNLLPDKTGTGLSIFTLAKVNGEIYRFQPSFPQSYNDWLSHSSLDLNINYSGGDKERRLNETFEGLSAVQTPDSAWRLFYGLSDQYGRGTFDNPGAYVNRLVYLKVPPNAPPVGTAFPMADNVHRGFTSACARGNDTLYVLYAQRAADAYFMQESYDGGQTWTESQPFSTPFPRSTAPMVLDGDSLRVLFYENQTHALQYARRHINGGQWKITPLFLSQQKGTLMAIDGKSCVYFDDFNKKLYLSRPTANGRENKLLPQVTGKSIGALIFHEIADGKIRIVYSDLAARVINRLIFDGTLWFDKFTEIGAGSFMDSYIIPDTDSIFVVYSDVLDGVSRLRYLEIPKGNNPGGKPIFESPDIMLGEYPSIKLDKNGGRHVSFFNRTEGALYYAVSLNKGLSWDSTRVAYGDGQIVGLYSTIALKDDKPVIAYIDAGENALSVATQSLNGKWTTAPAYTGASGNVTGPLAFAIDDSLNSYLLFTENGGSPQMRLVVNPANEAVWYEKNISGNTDKIASTYDLTLKPDTLFIFGRARKTGATGVGMITITNYRTLARPEFPFSEIGPAIFPNPSSGLFDIKIKSLNAGRFFLTITDVWGRKIGEQTGFHTGGGFHQAIDLSHAGPGVYLVGFRCEDEVFRPARVIVVAH